MAATFTVTIGTGWNGRTCTEATRLTDLTPAEATDLATESYWKDGVDLLIVKNNASGYSTHWKRYNK